jgi:acyl-coenzyme A synthetase/AMP-(fatty) acid ligase
MLPDFKMPREFIFIDDIPKSDRGKVVRDKLKERWMQENPEK